MSDVTVVMPTITGREEYLQKAVASLKATCDCEILIYKDLSSCGEAWAQGLPQATGDYLLPSADDLEYHPGWFEAAKRQADLGFLPAPRILNTDGSLQSCGEWEVEHPDGEIAEFTRAPFVSRSQWNMIHGLVLPFLDMKPHYFTDNVFTWAGRVVGYETTVCRGYLLTHHMAQQGRGAGMTWGQRMFHDECLYAGYIHIATAQIERAQNG